MLLSKLVFLLRISLLLYSMSILSSWLRASASPVSTISNSPHLAFPLMGDFSHDPPSRPILMPLNLSNEIHVLSFSQSMLAVSYWLNPVKADT